MAAGDNILHKDMLLFLTFTTQVRPTYDNITKKKINCHHQLVTPTNYSQSPIMKFPPSPSLAATHLTRDVGPL